MGMGNTPPSGAFPREAARRGLTSTPVEHGGARKRVRAVAPKAIGDTSLVPIRPASAPPPISTPADALTPETSSPQAPSIQRPPEDENPPPLLRDSPDSAAKTAAAAVQNISGAVGAADALAHATASGEAGALGVEIEAVLARMQEMMPAGVRLLDMARHGAGRDDAWRDATAAAARVRIEAMLEEDGLDGRAPGASTP